MQQRSLFDLRQGLTTNTDPPGNSRCPEGHAPGMSAGALIPKIQRHPQSFQCSDMHVGKPSKGFTQSGSLLCDQVFEMLLVFQVRSNKAAVFQSAFRGSNDVVQVDRFEKI